MNKNRLKAAASGEIHYVGAPCVHGHGTTRYVMSNRCVTCDKANARTQHNRQMSAVRALRKAVSDGKN